MRSRCIHGHYISFRYAPLSFVVVLNPHTPPDLVE